MSEKNDSFFMKEAIHEAYKAFEADDIPVGAILTFDEKIIGRGRNTRFSKKDPLGHAEIAAISQAFNYYNDFRYLNSTLYITLEPCLMCLGAIINARIPRIVFGATDKRFGALSLYNIDSNNLTNHKFLVTRGVLEKECADLLKNFFLKLRSEKRSYDD